MGLIGLFFAAIAAICNGSWTLSIKIKKVAELEPHPIVFNLFFSIGYVISSWIPSIAISAPLKLDLLGFVSGFILDASVLFAFIATQLVGVAVAAGIFCSVGLITSFVWGVGILSQDAHDLTVALCGIALILLAIAGVLSAKSFNPRGEDMDDDAMSQLPDVDTDIASPLNPLSTPKSKSTKEAAAATRRARGAAMSVLVGLCGGSYLAPSYYSTTDIYADKNTLWVFVGSLGVGVLAFALFAFFLLWSSICIRKFQQVESGRRWSADSVAEYLRAVDNMNWRVVGPYGALGGVVYLLSTACAFLAIFEDAPLAVVGTILQTALLVNGAWGICLFQELRGRAVGAFFASGVLMLGGAALVAYGG